LETRVANADTNLMGRLRLAGVLLIIGLIVELLTLFWTHALAFMAFLGIGCLFLAAGMAVFLWTVVSTAHHHAPGQVRD